MKKSKKFIWIAIIITVVAVVLYKPKNPDVVSSDDAITDNSNASSHSSDGSANSTLVPVAVAKNIEYITLGDYKIHTVFGVSNSHIIETPNKLILIDAQFTASEGKIVKDYMDSLEKPIDSVIISHEHPDHWFGIISFAGIKVLTTSEIAEDIATGAMRYIDRLKKEMGDEIPNAPVKLDGVLNLGESDFNGLKVIIEQYTDQEAHNSIVLKFPEYGVIIGQDLFYNGPHMVINTKDKNTNWINILKDFKTQPYNTFLVGHGKNTDKTILSNSIKYLNDFERIAENSDSKKEIITKMEELYPEKKASLRYLFIGLNRRFADH